MPHLFSRRARSANGPQRLLLGMVLATVAVACSDLPPVESRGSFTFGVFGDGPYRWTEMARFGRLIDDVDRAAPAFFIHIGDVLWYPCSDEAFRDRRDALSRIDAPVVYTPGDNEWADCHERIAGRYDPLDRLRAVRTTFFVNDMWSDIDRLDPARQSTAARWATYVENVRWTYGGIVFATLHLVGSDNAMEAFPGRTAANDNESRDRMRAALTWMAQAFALAQARDALAVVLAMHADPGFDLAEGERGSYGPFLNALQTHSDRWGKPVLLIHGDSHELHMDHPLRRPSGEVVTNVQRLETYGSPDIGWVRVVVDTMGPELFVFEVRKMPRKLLWW